MKFSKNWLGIESLQKQLLRKSLTKFDDVGNESLTAIFNRAGHSPYTPIDTGELRLSRAISKSSGATGFGGEFGYIKDYAFQ